jgi:hypothetical protein
MRVLICGGRDFDNQGAMEQAISELSPGTVVIHGGARGADRLAGECAKAAGLVVSAYPADWKTHGRAAGPIRNQRMLDLGKPDLVVAFPGGRGTADMVRRAKSAGVKVREIDVPRMEYLRPRTPVRSVS